jgi:hypothetical protein
LEELNLTKIYEVLEKVYPSVKSEDREAEMFVEIGKACNYHLIKAEI